MPWPRAQGGDHQIAEGAVVVVVPLVEVGKARHPAIEQHHGAVAAFGHSGGQLADTQWPVSLGVTEKQLIGILWKADDLGQVSRRSGAMAEVWGRAHATSLLGSRAFGNGGLMRRVLTKHFGDRAANRCFALAGAGLTAT